MKMVKKGYSSKANITVSASRKDNSLESYIEVKRHERQNDINARRSRTARYREKINSIANV